MRGDLSPESPPPPSSRTTSGRRSACLSKLNSMRPTSSQARRPARRGRRSSRRVPDLARNEIYGRQVTHRGELHIYQGDANDTMCRIPRKEVIQPQLPLRLPCYDFTPVTGPTFDGSFPRGVRPPASGVANSRGVTGGVYKARERIHPGVADPGLLATPTSRSRVADYDPN